VDLAVMALARLSLLVAMMIAVSPSWYTTCAALEFKLAHKYLHLVEMAVTGSLTDEAGRCNTAAMCRLDILLPYNATTRREGDDFPPFGHTMVGHLRLHNIRDLIKAVVRDNVPGDFAELGVWRGGSCIYAKAVLDVMAEDTRNVLVFDAFESISTYGVVMSQYLQTSVAAVEHNFAKYGLLDDHVKFFKGLFKDTVPTFRQQHNGSKIAILRIDGNFYDSYQDALYHLYELVPVGGYVIFGK
jgi:hypothetical protein